MRLLVEVLHHLVVAAHVNAGDRLGRGRLGGGGEVREEDGGCGIVCDTHNHAQSRLGFPAGTKTGRKSDAATADCLAAVAA